MSNKIFYIPAIMPTISSAILGMVVSSEIDNFERHNDLLRVRVRGLIDSQDYYESKNSVSNYLGDCLGCSTTDELLELIWESQPMSAFLTDLREFWHTLLSNRLAGHEDKQLISKDTEIIHNPEQLFDEVGFTPWLEVLANYING